MTPIISYDVNHVTVEGVTIARPTAISPKQWLDFWDKVSRIGSPQRGRSEAA